MGNIGEPQFNDARLPARFWTKARINSETGCWEWTGPTRRRGYGKLKVAGVELVAHRLSYEALVGPIPDGLQIDHLCRVTGCINPAHLEPVTQQENMRRARLNYAQPDHCRKGHPYTPENTYFNPHDEARVCRTCQRETWKKHSGNRAKRGETQ